jgi:TatA/E family protein of Tat protein translocase
MFGFSIAEVILFAVVVLLLFGKRLPATMRSLGEGVRAFRETARETLPAVEARESA